MVCFPLGIRCRCCCCCGHCRHDRHRCCCCCWCWWWWWSFVVVVALFVVGSADSCCRCCCRCSCCFSSAVSLSRNRLSLPIDCGTDSSSCCACSGRMSPCHIRGLRRCRLRYLFLPINLHFCTIRINSGFYEYFCSVQLIRIPHPPGLDILSRMF